MTNVNTAANATMNISPTSTVVSANTKPLFYNGAQASATNSWGANEIISVYYDGTNYQATNSQGGGGKAEKIKYDNSQSGLAAENVQGALDEINKEVLDISTVLHDVTLPSGSTGLISGQSTWLTAGTHYRLQRNGSTNVLRVTAGADTAYVAFLPSYPSKITNNLPVTFCSGTSRELISAGVTKDFEIPDTCTDIIITKAYAGIDYTPSSVKVGVKTKEQVIQNTKDIEAINTGGITFRQGYIKANSTYNDTVKVANRIFSQPIKGNFRVKVKDGYRIRQILFFDNEGNFIRLTDISTTAIEETVFQSSGFVSLIIAKADATASITPDEDIVESITDVGELFDFVKIHQGGVSTTSISYATIRAHCKVRGAVDVEVNSGYVIRYVCIQYLDGTWGLLQDVSTTTTTFSCPQTKAGDIYITFAMSDSEQDIDPSADIIKSIVFDGSEMVKEVVRNIIQNKKKSYLPSKVFTISVDTNVADNQSQTLALQDTQVFETDNGKIYLPQTYSAEGTPTRLIIHCHGASQNYNNGNVFPSGSMNITLDYLLAKGYAVMDVNGMPGTHSFFATTSGNPVALRSYIKAYDWVIKNFNLYKEIFVVGISAGSIPALQISNLDIIPVLASATYCGIMDFSRAWMLLGGYHPNNQGPAIKSYLADKYAFVGTRPTFGNVDPCSDEEWKYIVGNAKQFVGWNTFTTGITSTITKEQYMDIVSVVYGSTLPSWIQSDNPYDSIQQMLLAFKIPQRGNLAAYQTAIEQEKNLFDTCAIQRQVPIKLFHASNDNIAPYRYSQYYYEMCKRGGSIAELRTFTDGGHSPTGNTLTVTVNGVEIATNVLSVELLNWFQRFE